jgi:hypothetical protein
VYVHTVATRYKGRIASYEIWNEPDAATFWSGTISELVHLARVARNAVRRADPGAHLVSPGPVLRSGLFWARGYAAAGGYRYADVVAVHGYPVQGAGPEEGQVMIDEFRDELAGIGVRKPIWNSETNLETNVAESVELSVNRQSAYVVRLYLLSWAQGIQQVSWYDWSASRNLGVRMASRTGGTAAAAPGRAFSVVRSWMRGTMIGCTVSTNQTYRCDFTYRHGGGVVRWNPTRTVKVQAPPATVYRQNMYGKRTESRAATSSRVGYAPVLFRTSLRPSTQAGDPRARGESQTRIP